ncbi:5-(carboxyamino)imidazole ribonucleotide synthase [Actinobacteria bacterium YIM 96077]|uniref:N5-carboxyaminoimidazole ribonucleotide synthase n=1 Tax=Phytoactinopolyspora halophila TaxID=1981511 RepID=A0A329R6D0_9ACTN|nr:5-(carboxyamino)imidazole ribonucleotide synthase [Actinobacteria bacterium YIM 96077]RAW18992.1 5-(carboxyamino)imidazole ribonucleotide synthase [Phytoactinopolyspora halophila]
MWPVVGIVGGGQLARMTYPAALELGVRLSVLAAHPDDSAAQVARDPVVADEKALDDLEAFAKACDVVTFDHEHVAQEHLRALEAAGVPLRPGSDALLYAQDKVEMRARLSALGIPCPSHRIVAGPGGVASFLREHGGQAVLKTARGGYDGKGVWLVDDVTPAEVVAEPFRAGVPVLAEERVAFRREVAAMVARSPHGQAVAYPVVESVQRDGVCAEVIAPAPEMPEERAVEAQRIALTVAAELDVVGILAVEMFETTEGDFLVNELAMRPHNSGHWTIDGAVTSQFENHLRAVLDLPLGEPQARAPYTVMVNILGGDLPEIYPAYRHVMARDPGVKVHWYGKSVRRGRKVGHVTAYGDDLESLRERAWHAAEYIRGDIDE